MFDYVVKKKHAEKVFCDYISPVFESPSAAKHYHYIRKERHAIILTYQK